MARQKQVKRIKNPINGWLALDKPFGITSNEALGKLKRVFSPQKVGHAGTLDPRASGLLPVAFGEATKTVPFVMDGRKVYRFEVTWGAETDTDDTEGEVIATSEIRPGEDAIAAVLAEFTGTIMQVPPKFSAIKIAGERAYDLARDGAEVVLEARPIDVHRLDLVDCPDEDRAVFEAECGKGTYVRALARDLGQRLGTRGHVTELRRLLVGPFGEQDLVKLDEILAMAEELEEGAGVDALVNEFVLPVREAMDELVEIPVSLDDAAKIRKGMAVLLRGREAPLNSDVAFASHANVPVAIGSIDKGRFQPTRVFHL
ncbi:MAG: tRNA pseudouridine(55) synthase TruB [Roseibium album]|uniref:tRNA pseudouridine synthase B n=1 Tax=Roseibium album TaxID=311410 RepID=A0A0M7A1U2_9HYPH|nr:tRNA pseudouridine(55) synthase TruB [Roseibium album]MBG6164543.1 tRNA pseudouridine55 synthase [Labrenzia sp. EL_195]CTQ61214.1 tRNA pseudouridine synthase B [Roseibium album]CTQ67683.1 tRNA pseudouridine synthase B [Roseibium album]CTQ78951.1 tRNA pseudouridine synthase B [Roseibium album]